MGIYKIIGKKLKEYKESKGWGQQEMADLLGLTSQQVYSTWELGKKKLNAEDLQIIFVKTGIAPDFVNVTKNDGEEVSLKKVSDKLDSIQSQLFAHVVRSSERFVDDDKRMAAQEMDKIGKYAELFLKKQIEMGKP